MQVWKWEWHPIWALHRHREIIIPPHKVSHCSTSIASHLALSEMFPFQFGGVSSSRLLEDHPRLCTIGVRRSLRLWRQLSTSEQSKKWRYPDSRRQTHHMHSTHHGTIRPDKLPRQNTPRNCKLTCRQYKTGGPCRFCGESFHVAEVI
jgi:hypothetical protein